MECILPCNRMYTFFKGKHVVALCIQVKLNCTYEHEWVIHPLIIAVNFTLRLVPIRSATTVLHLHKCSTVHYVHQSQNKVN